MSLKSNTRTGGLSMIGVAQTLLLVDKLTGQIDISWWWVFSPVLLMAGLYGVLMLTSVTCFCVAWTAEWLYNLLPKRK